VVDDQGQLVTEFGLAIGHATCNVAEYEGLLAALQWAAGTPVKRLHVRSDSILLVKQMHGSWKVKHPSILPRVARARALVRAIGTVRFEWIPREKNTMADRIANRAMDAVIAA